MYYNFIQKLIAEKFADNLTAANTVLIVGIVICIAVGYLLGSLNFSLIISKRFFNDDIREHGSGNAGSTNMLRTHGKAAAAATFTGDALKAAVSVALGAFLLSVFGAYVAGFACIVGHIFPLYYNFKGGKGVVTVAVVIAMTNIKTFVCLAIIFLIIVIGTKYVSLGSVISVLVYPLVLSKIVFSGETLYPFESIGVVFSFAIAALVTWKHKENIKRIYNHTENKLTFSKKKKEGAPKQNKNGKDK